MIDPKELMIGAWVQSISEKLETWDKSTPVYYQIKPEDFADLDMLLALYEPIPLTEERLDKFGFKNTELGWTHNSRKFFLYVHYIDGNNLEKLEGWALEIEQGGRSVWVLLKGVHHLQRLWYDLTGEELKI